MDTSPSIQGLLGHSSAMGIYSADEVEGSKPDDLYEEDEEEGWEGGDPPAGMWCR